MKKLLAITALSAALFFGQTAAAEEKAAEEVKPSHVEMVLVLDESGSMSNLTNDTIGGFNSMIEKEKKLDVDAHVTTVLFNDQYKMLYNRRDQPGAGGHHPAHHPPDAGGAAHLQQGGRHGKRPHRGAGHRAGRVRQPQTGDHPQLCAGHHSG